VLPTTSEDIRKSGKYFFVLFFTFFTFFLLFYKKVRFFDFFLITFNNFFVKKVKKSKKKYFPLFLMEGKHEEMSPRCKGEQKTKLISLALHVER